MIEVRVGTLETVSADALLRPVAGDWAPVTVAMRRFATAAGPALAERCSGLGELPVGSAVITDAGELDAEFMVHVAVRSANEPVRADAVRRGLLNGLRRLAAWEIESVAMPALGTGPGHLDAEQSADAMAAALTQHLAAAAHPSRIIIVVPGEYERDAFDRRLSDGS